VVGGGEAVVSGVLGKSNIDAVGDGGGEGVPGCVGKEVFRCKVRENVSLSCWGEKKKKKGLRLAVRRRTKIRKKTKERQFCPRGGEEKPFEFFGKRKRASEREGGEGFLHLYVFHWKEGEKDCAYDVNRGAERGGDIKGKKVDDLMVPLFVE